MHCVTVTVQHHVQPRPGHHQQQRNPASKPPHIIMVLADDLGYNDIGYAGDDFAGLTPTLDALRRRGIDLQNYYTQQLCTPARAALLTGRYPYKMGMQGAALATAVSQKHTHTITQ